MNRQVNLPEGSVAEFLHELVEVEASRRELLVAAHELAVVLDDLVSLSHDLLVELHPLACVEVLVPLVD